MNLYKKAGLGIAMGLMSLASFAQSPTVNCNGVADWSASGTYWAGDKVVEDGILYEANWWTQDDPTTHNGGAGSGQPWTEIGECGSNEPELEITSPANNATFYFAGSQNPTIDVTVDVNDEEVAIDSVKYIVVERTCNVGGCTEVSRFTETSAPYTLTFNPIVGATYTEINAIAFSNGIPSEEKTIDLDVNALPEGEFTNIADDQVIFVNEGENFEVELDVNNELTSIDSVEYFVTEWSNTQSPYPTYREFTVYGPSYNLSFLPTYDCYQSRIVAVVYGDGGKTAGPSQTDVFVQFLRNASVTFTNPTQGETIYVDFPNNDPINITVDLEDKDDVVFDVHYFVTDAYGSFNSHRLAPNFPMEYNCRAEGPVTVVATFHAQEGYTVVAQDTLTFNVVHTSGARIASEEEVAVFPNPMSDVLNIENAGEFTSFEITDITGRTIATGSLNEGTATISTADLNSGIYTVVLKGAETKVVKVMK